MKYYEIRKPSMYPSGHIEHRVDHAGPGEDGRGALRVVGHLGKGQEGHLQVLLQDPGQLRQQALVRLPGATALGLDGL